jgi:hypothetical protein
MASPEVQPNSKLIATRRANHRMPKLMKQTDRDNQYDIKEIRITYDSTIFI